jgi:magnesium transporter
MSVADSNRSGVNLGASVEISSAELFPSHMRTPGTDAGIDLDDLAKRPTLKGSVRVTCIDYCPEQVQEKVIANLPEFIAQHRPEWSQVRWIRVEGLQDMDAIRAIAQKYQLHPLAVEDVLTTQRAKVEDYPAAGDQPGRLFVVARTIQQKGKHLAGKQVSFFLGRHTLVSFEDAQGPLFDAVKRRIELTGSRLRVNDVSFLLYSLLHAVVDGYFPMLEHTAEQIEQLERAVLIKPTNLLLVQMHRLRRDMMTIRRSAWPMRELILELRREGHECFSENTRTYLREVSDHILVIVDLSETYRDTLATLTETYMSSVANRMNEIMKMLTLINTIFVPLTFITGVYGMNFEHMPEKNIWWAYPVFWCFCLTLMGFMIWWFRRKNWF